MIDEHNQWCQLKKIYDFDWRQKTLEYNPNPRAGPFDYDFDPDCMPPEYDYIRLEHLGFHVVDEEDNLMKNYENLFELF